MLACALALNASVARAELKPISVEVPFEGFSRRTMMNDPLKGQLWPTDQGPNKVVERAVLIVGGDFGKLAGSMQAAGFPVLELKARSETRSQNKTLLEDIQSGVSYLKSNALVKAARVIIVAQGLAANASVSYAGANKQMSYILDGIVVNDPSSETKKIPFPEPLKNIRAIPVLLVATPGNTYAVNALKKGMQMCEKTKCRIAKAKEIVDFVIKPL